MKISKAGKEKDKRIEDLEKDLSSLRISHEKELSGLKDQLKAVANRVDVAEKKSELLDKDVEDLKAQINMRRLEEDVIKELKESHAYTKALADTVALKITRCWVVAERVIKTIPGADWEIFVEKLLEAEALFKRDGIMLEPYDRLCLFFPRLSLFP